MAQNTPKLSLDLARFDVAATLQCGNRLRMDTRDASTLDDAASAVARCLFDSFVIAETGVPACALVRVYVTRSYALLTAEQQQFARALVGERHALTGETKCLVLQGTAGLSPDWQSPADSKGHRVIPLPSEEFVRSAPMIASLIEQFGLQIADVVRSRLQTEPELLEKNYNVFHVEHAVGSAYIPAESDFVVPYGIASVVGFGGVLGSGDLYAAILFSRVHIPYESAKRFRSLALALRAALFSLRAKEA